MIYRSVFSLICLVVAGNALANTQYQLRGKLSTKLTHNTGDANENTGQRFYSQFEQVAIVSDQLSYMLQARWNYSSLYTDVSNSPAVASKDTHELYPGENYIKWQSSNWVIQTGYQEISWGESFGFNFADFINPQDQTMTLYEEVSESKYPLFLVNLKYFLDNGSLQFLYCPEPRFNKPLPINLFTEAFAPSVPFTSLREKTPNFFDENEWGGKFSFTYSGLDSALYLYDYLDRVPYYELASANATSVIVAEKHARIKSYGASLAKTIFDDFVLRTDFVLNQDRILNTVTTTPLGPSFSTTKTDEIDIQVSLDTPTYQRFSGAFIFAHSTLSDLDLPALREKTENYAIGKISYDFGQEKIFDLSYTHQFSHTGHAVQAFFNWPVTDLVELRMGGETYWGADESTLGQLKNISNVFFGLKTYFQL